MVCLARTHGGVITYITGARAAGRGVGVAAGHAGRGLDLARWERDPLLPLYVYYSTSDTMT